MAGPVHPARDLHCQYSSFLCLFYAGAGLYALVLGRQERATPVELCAPRRWTAPSSHRTATAAATAAAVQSPRGRLVRVSEATTPRFLIHQRFLSPLNLSKMTRVKEMIQFNLFDLLFCSVFHHDPICSNKSCDWQATHRTFTQVTHVGMIETLMSTSTNNGVGF